MTVREKFEKLVEQKRFLEIESFLDAENFESGQEKINFWLDYISILENIKFHKLNMIYSKVLNIFIQDKSHNELQFINFVKNIRNNYRLSAKEELVFLNSLWDCGKLKDFYFYSNQLLDRYLSSKSLSVLVNLADFLKTKNSKWIRPIFFQLMVKLLQSDFENIIKVSNEITSMLDNDWKKLQFKKDSVKNYYLKLLNLLEMVEVKNSSLEMYILQLKGTIFANFNLIDFKLTKREIVKLLIAYPDEIHALIIGISNADEKVRNLLIKFTKNHKLFSLVQIKKRYPFVQKYFSPKTKITISRQEDSAIIKDLNQSIKSKNKSSTFKILKHEVSAEEIAWQKNFIYQIRQGIFTSSEMVNDLVVVFYNLGLLDAAIEILNQEERTLKNLYLLFEIYFKQQRYIDIICEIGLLRSENSIDIPVEILYLEAESYLMLNKTESANKIYYKILTIDPEFRMVKERVNNA